LAMFWKGGTPMFTVWLLWLLSFFSFDSTEDWTQGLILARQELFDLNYTPSLFAFSLFFSLFR
jgi:hypothetical protein